MYCINVSKSPLRLNQFCNVCTWTQRNSALHRNVAYSTSFWLSGDKPTHQSDNILHRYHMLALLVQCYLVIYRNKTVFRVSWAVWPIPHHLCFTAFPLCLWLVNSFTFVPIAHGLGAGQPNLFLKLIHKTLNVISSLVPHIPRILDTTFSDNGVFQLASAEFCQLPPKIGNKNVHYVHNAA
jgi:hypothetical protein